jgi:hypothetical protein
MNGLLRSGASRQWQIIKAAAATPFPNSSAPPHLSEQCQNTNKAEEHSTHGFGCVGCVGCVALRCLAGFGFGGLLRSQWQAWVRPHAHVGRCDWLVLVSIASMHGSLGEPGVASRVCGGPREASLEPHDLQRNQVAGPVQRRLCGTFVQRTEAEGFLDESNRTCDGQEQPGRVSELR